MASAATAGVSCSSLASAIRFLTPCSARVPPSTSVDTARSCASASARSREHGALHAAERRRKPSTREAAERTHVCWCSSKHGAHASDHNASPCGSAMVPAERDTSFSTSSSETYASRHRSAAAPSAGDMTRCSASSRMGRSDLRSESTVGLLFDSNISCEASAARLRTCMPTQRSCQLSLPISERTAAPREARLAALARASITRSAAPEAARAAASGSSVRRCASGGIIAGTISSSSSCGN
mmetsp:Transcript_7697/g.31266  ORF Transcript_7697/g.31266 Transcript_7697/m.31266 type:complete len:241 (+) Transcript_7697:755-1477(+)